VVAVIGVVGGDDPGLAGHRLRHPQRHVVGLGPGAGHDRLTDAVAQPRAQTLDVIQHQIMQIAGMGVQHRRLLTDRLHHPRVTMADMGHVVVAIEIALARRIPQPYPLPFDDVNGRSVKGRYIRPHQPRAARDDLVCPVFGHSSSATFPRIALTSPRTALATILRRWLPSVGRVATRRLGATNAARIISTSRASASSRLRA